MEGAEDWPSQCPGRLGVRWEHPDSGQGGEPGEGRELGQGGWQAQPCSGAFSWMEACLKEELPPPVELEESLRNGVLLAKLGHCFAPAVVPLKKIYDVEQLRYQVGREASPFYRLPLACPSP